uniref:Uncharacterized protein n=1 Tax=Rhabditophanes sp. KR3021 TaxID=114890 RepID=A0AC35U0Y9_9BILA
MDLLKTDQKTPHTSKLLTPVWTSKNDYHHRTTAPLMKFALRDSPNINMPSTPKKRRDSFYVAKREVDNANVHDSDAFPDLKINAISSSIYNSKPTARAVEKELIQLFAHHSTSIISCSEEDFLSAVFNSEKPKNIVVTTIIFMNSCAIKLIHNYHFHSISSDSKHEIKTISIGHQFYYQNKPIFWIYLTFFINFR